MVTPSQAEDLLLPLVVRAHAVRAWPQTGFVDQAAEYLVRKLELEKPTWSSSFAAHHQLEVSRCQWIDHQVLDFLTQYPDAMGIELGAGLSTRFQRLSAQTDWPRFSWVDVDTRDVIDCADLIFPKTDNYRWVACDIWREDWLEKSRWRPGLPLIVVVETSAQPDEISALKKMLAHLIKAATVTDAPVHLILDYASPALQKIRKELRCMLYGKSCAGFRGGEDLIERLSLQGHVVSETDLAATTSGPLLHRWLAKIYCRLTQKCFWGAVHIQLCSAKRQSSLAAGL